LVDRLHEPSRLVGADTDDKVIDPREQLADLLKRLAVRAVAAEVDRPVIHLNDVASPQTPVRVKQPSPRPVTRGHEVDLYPSVARVELLKPPRRHHAIR